MHDCPSVSMHPYGWVLHCLLSLCGMCPCHRIMDLDVPINPLAVRRLQQLLDKSAGPSLGARQGAVAVVVVKLDRPDF